MLYLRRALLFQVSDKYSSLYFPYLLKLEPLHHFFFYYPPYIINLDGPLFRYSGNTSTNVLSKVEFHDELIYPNSIQNIIRIRQYQKFLSTH